MSSGPQVPVADRDDQGSDQATEQEMALRRLAASDYRDLVLGTGWTGCHRRLGHPCRTAALTAGLRPGGRRGPAPPGGTWLALTKPPRPADPERPARPIPVPVLVVLSVAVGCVGGIYGIEGAA